MSSYIIFTLAVVGSGVIGVALFVAHARKLGSLIACMHAIARREPFIQIPYVKDRGLHHRIAQGLLSLKEAVAEADALAAEQKAAQDQHRSASIAQKWFLDTFNQSEQRLIAAIAEVDEAALALRATAQSMLDQADKAQQQSAAMSRMADVAASGVSTVAEEASNLTAMAEQLHAQVGNAQDVTASAVDIVARTDGDIGNLSESAARIENVVAVIGRITSQTRLLALNATIEACLAGDAGKGFAVVAGEVKALSAQTDDATATIASDVHQMGRAVRTSSLALESIGAAIRSIEGVTRDVQSLVIGESRAASEISRQAAEVSSSVRLMSDHAAAVENSSSETRTMANHLMNAAEGLAGQSDVLNQTVTGFLDDIRRGAIKIGVLHSLSGTMAMSEQPLKDLLVMMVEEVNRAGGLLGRPLELVIVNPRSDWSRYEGLAHALLAEDEVAALFGCWTSISRKAVLPVVEKLGGLLFYPVQYEGEEQSPNIFYTGATPNQQAIPAIDFLLSPAGGSIRRFALIGTDYIYPQVTNRILQSYLRARGIAEPDVLVHLAPFSHAEWGTLVKQLRHFAKGVPTAIISTINGDSNVHFFRELAKQGVRAADLPVMAFSVGENEVSAMPAGLLDGHYVAWNYLMAVETAENARFLDQWRHYTADPSAVTDDPMEATWIGFNLWCEAVRQVGSTDPALVRAAIAGRRVRAPSGFEVIMDPDNHHLHKPVFIGRVTSSRGIEIISRSESVVAPSPFSSYLSRPHDGAWQ
jgi:urea transport system substrate-binding protein